MSLCVYACSTNKNWLHVCLCILDICRWKSQVNCVAALSGWAHFWVACEPVMVSWPSQVTAEVRVQTCDLAIKHAFCSQGDSPESGLMLYFSVNVPMSFQLECFDAWTQFSPGSPSVGFVCIPVCVVSPGSANHPCPDPFAVLVRRANPVRKCVSFC